MLGWLKRKRDPKREERAADRRALDEAGRAVRNGGTAVVPGGTGLVPEVAPARAVEAAKVVRAALAAPEPPPIVVVVSTDRRPGTAEPKSGDALSPAYLAYVRNLPCGFCGEKKKGPSDPHHFPSKGSLGMQVDLFVAPACRGPGTQSCHDRAQQYSISKATQAAAVLGTLGWFMRKAPVELKRQVFTEILASLS